MENSFNTRFLNEIVTILQKGMDSQDTFEAIFNLLKKNIYFDSATLFLYKKQKDKLKVIHSKGEDIVDLASEFNFERGNGISSWISKQKEPIILPSLEKSRPGEDHRFSSFVSMPLWAADKLIGVFNLGHYEPNFYQRDDISKFRIVANQLSMIMEKIQLQKKLQEKNTKLKNTVAKLKKTHKKLIQKERLAAIGEVAVTVNHEINNPLTSIIGLAEVLELAFNTGKKEKVKEGLQGILKEAKRIQKVTQKLANVSESKSISYLNSQKMIDIND
ncbi:MAG: GAF domain-containing protein [Candidatus Marinimicrobia bacterium]|nr:GAF domain-containing protein [Candidatus Neomarinimicrobiota bacterium]